MKKRELFVRSTLVIAVLVILGGFSGCSKVTKKGSIPLPNNSLYEYAADNLKFNISNKSA